MLCGLGEERTKFRKKKRKKRKNLIVTRSGLVGMKWYRPGATGGIPAPFPLNENCAPPIEDCDPEKLTGSGLLECKSRPKTPKLVFIALKFVSKNCFFVIFVGLYRISLKFWNEDLFFLSLLQNLWKIARNLRRQPELVEILGRIPFFLVFTFFVWSSIVARRERGAIAPPPPYWPVN